MWVRAVRQAPPTNPMLDLSDAVSGEEMVQGEGESALSIQCGTSHHAGSNVRADGVDVAVGAGTALGGGGGWVGLQPVAGTREGVVNPTAFLRLVSPHVDDTARETFASLLRRESWPSSPQ